MERLSIATLFPSEKIENVNLIQNRSSSLRRQRCRSIMCSWFRDPFRFELEWGHWFTVRNPESFLSGWNRYIWDPEPRSDLIRNGVIYFLSGILSDFHPGQIGAPGKPNPDQVWSGTGSFSFYPEFQVIFIWIGLVPLGNGIRIRFDSEWVICFLSEILSYFIWQG